MSWLFKAGAEAEIKQVAKAPDSGRERAGRLKPHQLVSGNTARLFRTAREAWSRQEEAESV